MQCATHYGLGSAARLAVVVAGCFYAVVVVYCLLLPEFYVPADSTIQAETNAIISTVKQSCGQPLIDNDFINEFIMSVRAVNIFSSN